MGNQLLQRQRIEKNYHDKKFKNGAASNNDCRGGIGAYEFYWELIGDVKGLKVLDFGCGDGWMSIWLVFLSVVGSVAGLMAVVSRMNYTNQNYIFNLFKFR